MARARQRDAWDRASLLAMLLHNAHCKKGSAKPIERFHPYIERPPPRPLSREQTRVALLGAFFPDRIGTTA